LTALVTGANRGLGFETCRQLGERGYRVILTSRGEREGKAAAAKLAAENLTFDYRRLDVDDRGSIAALVSSFDAARAKLDVLVNNAAVGLDGFDGEVARRTTDINLFGPMHVTDALLPFMPDGATIVMVSSGAGELSGFSRELRAKFLDEDLTREALVALVGTFVRDVEEGTYRKAGWPQSAYKVSKASLNALTRILAAELARRRIKVNAVCPGWVRTDMGGPSAPRSLAKGAASIVRAAVLDANGPTGGFFRDGKTIAW
jgi:NAD(P)-dependent dehydrogenase (short-subunit alcohol dehydrogenase family)